MDIPVRGSSKGQITIPAQVRRALGLQTGDYIAFRLVDKLALVHWSDATAERERIPNFFDLAGSVPVPADVDRADWRAQRERAWSATVNEGQ